MYLITGNVNFNYLAKMMLDRHFNYEVTIFLPLEPLEKNFKSM